MQYRYKDEVTLSEFLLIRNEKNFDRYYYARPEKNKFYTIAWNYGPAQKVFIDEVQYQFPAYSILPLMIRQSFRFERPQQVIAWQFNAEFYCILNHDKEVGCIGFLFYGSAEMLFIKLDRADRKKVDSLLRVFEDEFDTIDEIQEDMLQMLLKRLIIITTRLAKKQFLARSLHETEKYDLVRKFNLLVEINFRKQHQVSFYAQELSRSPKTLANLFALYNHKSPLQVIHERIALEAKRLLQYTSRSVKEISFELGFEDAAHFNNFFKKHYQITPIAFRRELK